MDPFYRSTYPSHRPLGGREWSLQCSQVSLNPLLSTQKFFFSTHLFALIIGINTYKSKDIKPLRGAVADARAFAAYLGNQLSVPQDHIIILENESATRAAILENLLSLVNDPRIRPGDPIVIFYAGHGSEAAAPPGWEAGGRKANIQVTMPYDVYCQSGGRVVDPIPDRTLDALLAAISQKKGSNIVSFREIPTSKVCLTIR